jgi:bis(5'-nucleosidyl)-tetraphosphatase
MPQLIEAGGFLLFHQGAAPCFLLMQHANRWDLPKGHAEGDEEILQTALRETEEETGIPAADIVVDRDFRFIVEYQVSGTKRGDYLKRVTYFLGYVPRPVAPILTEHIGFRWFEWPAEQPLQASTIDPLLEAATNHFALYPERLNCYS